MVTKRNSTPLSESSLKQSTDISNVQSTSTDPLDREADLLNRFYKPFSKLMNNIYLYLACLNSAGITALICIPLLQSGWDPGTDGIVIMIITGVLPACYVIFVTGGLLLMLICDIGIKILS